MTDTRADGLHAAYQTACRIANRDRADGIEAGIIVNNILGELAILAGRPLARTTAWWMKRTLLVVMWVCVAFLAIIGLTAYMLCD
jgi:hypothetical protein